MSIENNIELIPDTSVGVSLKPAHYHDVLSPKNGGNEAGSYPYSINFYEVHAENYMCDGGPPHAWLHAIREKYSLSIHGVCLSLGGVSDPDKDHLERLRTVVDRFNPALVSEHLAWCAHDGVFYNDLIAPPLTEESFHRTVRHIDQVQNALGRRILIENPSQYLKLPGEMSEPDFLNELAKESQCGLLLDINNVYVSASNLNFDPIAYVDAINAEAVKEVHLAGHSIDNARGVEIRVDDHGSPVCDAVGVLYSHFIKSAGPKPTLVEWDTDTPALHILVREAEKAAGWMANAADAADKTLPAAHHG